MVFVVRLYRASTFDPTKRTQEEPCYRDSFLQENGLPFHAAEQALTAFLNEGNFGIHFVAEVEKGDLKPRRGYPAIFHLRVATTFEISGA